MSGHSIQVSLTHTTLGIAMGAMIEGLMPVYKDTNCMKTQTLELAVQMGLNGLILSMLAGFLAENDPTYGIPFSAALFAAQPEVRKRMQHISKLLKSRVAEAALTMAAQM